MGKKFSELERAVGLNNGDLVAFAQVDQSAPTGYKSKSAPMSLVSQKILKDTEYASDLQTDDKTVLGAINEVNSRTIAYDVVSGPIANFKTSLELPFESLEADVSRIQDLHGYDYPWTEGAGKNKLPPNETDGSTTINGVTFTASNGVYKIVGLATDVATITFPLKSSVDMSPSTQKIAFLNNKSASSVTLFFCRDGSSIHYWQMNPVNRIGSGWIDSGNEIINEIRISVTAGSSVDLTISPMFLLLTESEETTFNPYENICPISGWSEVTIKHSKKNFVDNSHISDETHWELIAYQSFIYPLDLPKNATLTISGQHTVPEGLSPYVYLHEKQPDGTWTSIMNFWQSQQNLLPRSFTTKNTEYRLWAYNAAASINTIDWLQIEAGTSASNYEQYSEPITEVIDLGGTYYGGHFTQDRDGHRQFAVTHNYIASYNGETINEPWISSMDAYSQGATPTTGAQVVYPLATPYTIDLLDGEPIVAFQGVNNIYADSGDASVEYALTIEEYIDKKIASVQALILNS